MNGTPNIDTNKAIMKLISGVRSDEDIMALMKVFIKNNVPAHYRNTLLSRAGLFPPKK